ncbi:MAG: DNA repair protein RecN [Erysipelotrichaceae bacterium]|nr:DNA repair protein RecN [Erysipelotrichaceae bacterium]
MLKSLRIKDYAIIDDLSIEFEDGFNVFTGETGAGKSIIVGALSMLMKGRSDSSMIKTGKEKAVVEGVFAIDDEELKSILNAQDIDYEGELIIKRVISTDNRNSIKINESNVTLGFLTETLSKYVDIHSQKDSQLLFDKQYQLKLLDKYAADHDLLNRYSEKYDRYVFLRKEYDDLLENNYNEREIEFFRFDLDELENADIKTGEEEELETLEKRYKSSEKYLTVLNNSLSLYKKDGGIREQLYDLINELNIDDEKILNEKEAISSIYYSLDEHIDVLNGILDSFSSDYLDIESIEERLYTYTKLKRKHKCDVEGLLALKDELRAKIEAFEDRDRVLGEKEKEVNNAFNEALSMAKELHKARSAAAAALRNDILRETNDLLLNNCNFEISFKETELGSKGIDDVEYFVSMNKGEDLKPLKQVASGGEISRLMLALKSVFAKISDTDLLILDEIDTGVSGNVALAVGEKIAKIAKNSQVLCITHLSPVAACADSHYLIYKEDDEISTSTKVRRLDQEEILEELASISNTSTNAKAIDAARELYESAQKIVKEL